MNPAQVLSDTQTTSEEFRFSGKVGFVILSGYTSGTWTLQVEAPDGSWIDSDINFTGNGIKSFDSTHSLNWRLTGGDAGAEAWVSDDDYHPGYTGLA